MEGDDFDYTNEWQPFTQEASADDVDFGHREDVETDSDVHVTKVVDDEAKAEAVSPVTEAKEGSIAKRKREHETTGT